MEKVDIQRLPLEDIIQLDAFIVKRNILGQISMQTLIRPENKVHGEAPYIIKQSNLATFLVSALFPTQNGISQNKYNLLTRHPYYQISPTRAELKELPRIKKYADMQLDIREMPIVVLYNVHGMHKGNMLLVGHIRARHKIDKNPDAEINAIYLDCVNENMLENWCNRVIELRHIYGINNGKITVQDLPLYKEHRRVKKIGHLHSE
jgi:hypothetical protein